METAIKLENVNKSFGKGIGKVQVLKDVNFAANLGELCLVLGPSGSGKSTLLYLLARFYDPNSGNVYLGNRNIKEYDKTFLNREIGFVFQKAMLANLSVKDNLNWKDPNLSEEELISSLKICKADFILNDEDKLDKLIYQGGKNLSGGERQRLSIARAIALKPHILFLDDSLSALDFKTDYEIRNNLKNLNLTTILVTERIEQIKSADLIIVLDNGEIVGMGQHTDLLINSKIYKEIYDSQTESEVI